MQGGSHVLSLYRLMLRKGRSLQLTDKNFYFRRVRDEFEKNRYLTSKEEIQFAVQKAEAFLKNDRVV
ncbi:hypothetical protein ACF0H5_018172 [Mactra antiquata]